MNGASVKIWRRTIDLRRNVFLLYFFNGVVKETREYTGEWAWLQFIQSGRNIGTGVYRLTFKGNDKLYFDWKVDSGNISLYRVLNSLPNLTIPQNILKR